jgi:hypothetical protein
MRGVYLWLVLMSVFALGGAIGVAKQTRRGGIVERPPEPTHTPPIKRATPRPTPPPCEAGTLVVHCNVPGCNVALDGEQPRAADANGQLIVSDVVGNHTVKVTLADYEDATQTAQVTCGATKALDFRLNRRGVLVHLRTNPPACDLYVNDPPVLIGHSDAEGRFDYTVKGQSILLGASKPGYLSTTKIVPLTPDVLRREVVINLEPIPATVTLSTEIAGARAQVDGEQETRAIQEPLLLAPGQHRLTVAALGYAPANVELELKSGEKIARAVSLERLPVAQLLEQAEAKYRARAYSDVLQLARYALAAEPGQAVAHRLMGQALLAQQNYGQAEAQLALALAGNESVRLPVRRHPHENFDPVKGHDLCEALLILAKSEVEFQGLRDASDNFKVPYAQVQMTGLQLKKNQYAFLGTRVSDARGKRREFNFFSYDKELTQEGTPYLTMLAHLLQPH